MNSKQQLLLTARTVIANKKYWTRNSVAKTKDGAHCLVESPEARKFCAVGALMFAYPGKNFPEKEWQCLWEAAMELGYEDGPAMLNDDASHKKVMKMFDRAIEIAETR